MGITNGVTKLISALLKLNGAQFANLLGYTHIYGAGHTPTMKSFYLFHRPWNGIFGK